MRFSCLALLLRGLGAVSGEYWGGAPSGLYSEPKRLARLGYLTARTEPGRTHPRTVYALTDPGREALRAWLAEPPRFPRVKNEAHLRLLAGDMLGDAAIVESFRGMLPELDRLEALAQAMYDRADRVPHRARYLRLSHAYALRLVALHREWVAEIERELGDAARDLQSAPSPAAYCGLTGDSCPWEDRQSNSPQSGGCDD